MFKKNKLQWMRLQIKNRIGKENKKFQFNYASVNC